MKIRSVILLIITAFCLCGCSDKKPQDPEFVRLQQQEGQKEKDEPGIDWNRVNVSREDEDIDFFTQRYGWKTQRMGTGLRFESLKEGSGQPIEKEDVVTVEYNCCLLTGDTVYTSKKDGVKCFKVDKSDEIAGLNEAVKLMKKGGKAHLVIPSFLGYGVAGDGDRIKGKVSLAMTIDIIDVKKSE